VTRTNFLETGGPFSCPTILSTPIALADYAPFQACLAQGLLYGVQSLETFNAIDQVYHQCPAGAGISAVLNSNGTLTISDDHAGGLRDRLRITLYFCSAPHFPPPGPCHGNNYVYIELEQPGRYLDKATSVIGSPYDPKNPCQVLTAEVSAKPGDWYYVGFNGTVDEEWVLVPRMTVEWVSTDASGIGGSSSVRHVDSSDLVELSLELGRVVRWGFPGEIIPPPVPVYGPRPARNFHVNFAPFSPSDEAIDASDIAAFAQDLGTSCATSKADAVSEARTMLEWFGFARSGRTIQDPAEGSIPEWVLVDPLANERAIRDPEGYRRLLKPATTGSWTFVKDLYR
jgi:hypothetical protein